MSAVDQKINTPFFRFQSSEKDGRVIPTTHTFCYVIAEERSGAAVTVTAQTSSVKTDAA